MNRLWEGATMTDTEPKPTPAEAEVLQGPELQPATILTEPDRDTVSIEATPENRIETAFAADRDTQPEARAAHRTETPSDPVRPTPAPPPRKSGSTLGGIVIGAVLAVGAGYGAQTYLLPRTTFDPAPLEARLTAAEAEAGALRAELARLAEAQAALPAPDSGLADRIAALETTEAPDLAPLSARLDAVEASLAALANTPSETGVSPAALAALQAEVAALKSQGAGASADLSGMVSEVEARLAEAEAKAGELTTQATAIAAGAARNAALAQIGAAFDSGLPYRAALTALGDAEVPEVIAAQADTGLPSIAGLRASFPEAARLALEQALRANPGDSWTDRVGSFLRNQTGARSLAPRDGTDPDAILSRAEAALARADVQTALTEVASLPREAQGAMADWTALAQQRLDAQAALARLLQGAGQ